MSRPGGRVRWFRLDRKNPEAWRVMPFFIARARDWGEQWDQGGIDEFLKRVEAAFILELPTVPCWVAVRDLAPWEPPQVVGHLIAAEDVYSGRNVGWVIQLAIEPFALPLADMRRVQEELEAWARTRGLVDLVMITARDEHRAWERLFGFKAARTIMTRRVGPGEGT